MHEYNSKIVSLSPHQDIINNIEDMDDKIEHLSNYASNLLFRNSSELKRTQTHLAVVYNFMSQKDNLTNISLASDSRLIAAASKRDSSAMKTIAVVTMLFLPGTYISALFAIPLFDWEAAPGVTALNYRFWYYWATTLPLTALVLFAWIFWEHIRVACSWVYRWFLRSRRSIAARTNQRDQETTNPEAMSNNVQPR